MAPHAPVNAWSIVFPESIWEQVQAHLYPGDADEHAGVLTVGTASSDRGQRLLVREFFPAQDGIDYVPGVRGYRRLQPDFVRDRILACRDEGLGYLAIHNHAGVDSAGFSSDDLASHERGYPALRDIGRGIAVGALVFGRRAIAGDLWLPTGDRVPLSHATVVGGRIRRFYPRPPVGDPAAEARFQRQALIFGAAGQAILRDVRVGIVGCGGVGMLLVEYLSRLGVGHLVVIDPDRVEVSNLPRLPGARLSDTGWFSGVRWPYWMRRCGRRFARPKVEIARRLSHQANPDSEIEIIHGDVLEPQHARRFTDVDYLFLAADTMRTRLLLNAIVQQYLVPGAQLGSKIRVDPATGQLLDVHSVVRPVTPDSGCLWCNELISPQGLAEEALTVIERARQRYVDDPEVEAPSVITLNAIAASQAANDFLFSATGLLRADATLDYYRNHPLTRDVRWDTPRCDADCPECGMALASRRARGDSRTLPTRVQP